MSVSGQPYPLRFVPMYKEKIWGGDNLRRLLGRDLPKGAKIGESWELADLEEGESVVSNGPWTGTTLRKVTRALGPALMGPARTGPFGRFPILVKILDAAEVLSLQVHPDARAVAEIGEIDARVKDECWYVLGSHSGSLCKGLRPGVSPAQFRKAVLDDTVEKIVNRLSVRRGEFHYIPSGTVHALGPGVVVVEIQTPSDTTYRVTDWGRGREIHVEQSMQCIRFDQECDAPGANGPTLLATEFFTVARRKASAGKPAALPAGRCAAVMMLSAQTPAEIR
ncbi:MAG: class I mannose-6-phosphate isomerase, partial [Planctomycetota bacterium]|nr:class I mannose-6-phosphate isomerase [Planctomycetota bacterium]